MTDYSVSVSVTVPIYVISCRAGASTPTALRFEKSIKFEPTHDYAPLPRDDAQK